MTTHNVCRKKKNINTFWLKKSALSEAMEIALLTLNIRMEIPAQTVKDQARCRKMQHPGPLGEPLKPLILLKTFKTFNLAEKPVL